MRTKQRGFTLIELMISLVLFSFVIAGVLAVAVSMSQGYREQRASVVAEEAVRVPLDFLGDAIRQASPGAPTNLLFDSITCTETGITMFNNVGTGSAAGTDRLDVIYASGAVLTSARDAYTSMSQTTLTVNDVSQFQVGDSFVLSDTTKGVLLKVTGVNAIGNLLTIAPQSSACGAPTEALNYPVGALVIRAQHAAFYIDYIDGNPNLMMDPDAKTSTNDSEPLAEGVEDLQVVAAMDKNVNNQIEVEGATPAAKLTDEWFYNVSGDTAPLTTYTMKAMRVTLVARTLSGLIGNLKSFNRPAAEDHAAAAANTDNFRRRILKATVEVRNMTGSP